MAHPLSTPDILRDAARAASEAPDFSNRTRGALERRFYGIYGDAIITLVRQSLWALYDYENGERARGNRELYFSCCCSPPR